MMVLMPKASLLQCRVILRSRRAQTLVIRVLQLQALTVSFYSYDLWLRVLCPMVVQTKQVMSLCVYPCIAVHTVGQFVNGANQRF